MSGSIGETAAGAEGSGFDRYRPRGELGRGGMGVVYRALDQRLNREVALKVLLRTGDAESVLRFKREAEAVGRLRHPGIVAVHDAGRDGQGHPYLAMDLLPGRSLQAWLDEVGVLDQADAVRIVAVLARALEHAHQAGVLHRDLKPANVMLDGLDGEPVLTDFGLARLVGRETRLTHTGDVLGTPVFMAPEQAVGDLVDARADVYGLGALLYALLVGKAPFGGSNLLAVLQSVRVAAPPPIRSQRAEISPQLEAVCLRCLEKDPARRFQTAADLARALDTLKGEGPVRRPPPLALVGTLAALLFVGVGAWGVAQTGPDHPRSPEAPEGSAQPETLQVADGASPPPGRHTVDLKPGPLEGKDTYVQSDGARVYENHGGAGELVVGRKAVTEEFAEGEQVAYLQFSLDRIPAGATFRAAELRLYLKPTPGRLPIVVEAVAPTINASQQGARQTPWVEGTSLGNELLDGMAWWGAPPGSRPIWGPRHPQFTHPAGLPGSQVLTEIPPLVSGYFTIPVDPIVRPWLEQRRKNLGFRISCDPARVPQESVAKHFFSSDASSENVWPTLTVQYEGSPPAPEPDRAVAHDVAQAAADRILDLLAAQPGSLEEDLAWLTAAVRVAPFHGRAWFERGRRLCEPRGGGGRSLIQAHSSLLRADQVLRPDLRAQELIRLRSWAAVKSGDAPRCDHAIRDLKRFLKQNPAASNRGALEALLRSAQEVSDRYRRVRKVVIQPGPLEGKDAHVRGDGWRANDNYGANRGLQVGLRQVGQKGEVRTLLQFDLARYLPDAAQVRQATLRLYDRGALVFHNRGAPHLDDPELAIVAQRVLQDWVEGSSGYDEHVDGVVFEGNAPDAQRQLRANRPDLTQPPVAKAVAGGVVVRRGHKGWVEIDVTSLAKAWHAAPNENHGVRLAVDPTRVPPGNSGKSFVSSDGEARLRPQLVVRYKGTAPLPQPSPEEQQEAVLKTLTPLIAKLAQKPPPHEQLRILGELVRAAPFFGDFYVSRAVVMSELGWSTDRVLAANAHEWLVIAWDCVRRVEDPLKVLNLMALAALRTQEPDRVKVTLALVESRWPHPALRRCRKALRAYLGLERR